MYQKPKNKSVPERDLKTGSDQGLPDVQYTSIYISLYQNEKQKDMKVMMGTGRIGNG